MGEKTVDTLIKHFKTEMNILHKITPDDIQAVVGEKVANNIIKAINGDVDVKSGGGGIYGKINI